MDNFRFLLGGYDLEMVAIRQLLVEHNYNFHDNHLAWGAGLSAYRDLLNDQEHFVGIELIEDIELPINYTSIDHHNENNDRPSAIEQVAELLGIELTRYQQLVAANDRGYITAMKAAGASNQEIEEIRKADRKAQGVTEEDEQLAVKSIKENLQRKGDLIIVNSLTPKFSTITDRLYPCDKLLISFDNHFVYYGVGKDKLAVHFNKLIKEGKAYHGGNENGFFGLAKGVFVMEEVLTLKAKVIQLIAGGLHE